jgi:hypothetical protein
VVLNRRSDGDGHRSTPVRRGQIALRFPRPRLIGERSRSGVGALGLVVRRLRRSSADAQEALGIRRHSGRVLHSVIAALLMIAATAIFAAMLWAGSRMH